MLSAVPGILKAKGVLWFWAPSGFCAKEEAKGVAAPTVPLCPPKLKPTMGVLEPAAGAPMPNVLPTATGVVDAPNVNGDGVELPNTEPPVLLFVV